MCHNDFASRNAIDDGDFLMKYLYILGACGSIGTQTLDIVSRFPDEFKVVGMSVGSDLNLAVKLIEQYRPEIVCFRKKSHQVELSYQPIVVYEDEGLNEIARYHRYENEWLVNALVGAVGCLPTVLAIQNQKNIALANKETLVIAGDLIRRYVEEYHVQLLPIDSEHSAILQCLQGESSSEVDCLWITASGGAFRDLSREELKKVTKEDALKHPNWKMGNKITIDCATMMNKGFEIIEAYYLFQLPLERIKAILHPQSIVHSMVSFQDGSWKAQLGISDMRLPIAYALFYPKRVPLSLKTLDLNPLSLEFKELSEQRYPCLSYAMTALKKGGLYLSVLNAANEAAVALFLKDKISFLQIEYIIKEEISKDYTTALVPTLEERLKVGKEVYRRILKEYGGIR